MKLEDLEKKELVKIAKTLKIAPGNKGIPKLISEIDLKLNLLNKGLIIHDRKVSAKELNKATAFRGFHPITGEKVK